MALLIPILALSIPIVAILSKAFVDLQKMRAETSAATSGLEAELDEAAAERDRLRRRIEVLEAIVTTEGFDLEREARRAGLTADRLDPTRVDPDLLDFDAPEADADRAARRRRTR